ncbi:hypothetical protein Slin15195_G021230 [Septoria linicola]|uniref:Uncharacterized protein n=1 Tax=Septoria linicola TaxID=215465 RepID=A0A9Q9AJ45_9PEZI|nr:hypothetical protein Slin15195_G021230 [Septoria linicola]
MSLDAHTSEFSNPCFLLDLLPAELRNNIYELAFTTEHEPGEVVALFDAKPPVKNLLSTCQTVNKEARGMYLEAYRKFWREIKFHHDYDEQPLPTSITQKHCLDRDLDQITNFTLTCHAKVRVGYEHKRICTMVDKSGLWKIDVLRRTPPSQRAVPVEWRYWDTVFVACKAVRDRDSISKRMIGSITVVGGPTAYRESPDRAALSVQIRYMLWWGMPDFLE